MDQVRDNKRDFKGLDDLNLTGAALKNVQQARVEARSIIDRLDPEHISSFADLIEKLNDALKEAKMNKEISASKLSMKG